MPNRPDPLTASQPDAWRFAPGAIIHRAARQSESDPYQFVMATDDVDRMGDVIEIGGIDLTAFSENPIALWNHDFSQPIGTWQNVRRTAGRLIGDLVLAAQGTSAKVDELRRFLEQRILKTVSVGFRVLEAEPIKGTFGVYFTRSELLECSLVPIPANAGARRLKALFPTAPDFIFSGDQGPIGSSKRTGAAAPIQRRELASIPREPPKMPRTIAERITSNLSRSATIDDELNAIQLAAANDDDRDFTEDENTRIEALSDEKLALVESMKALRAAETVLATNAKPAGAAPRVTVEPQFAKREAPHAILFKLGTVAAISALSKRPVEQVIAERYGQDERVAACMGIIQRTATNIADTTTPSWAAELVSTTTLSFIDDLRLISIFAGLRARASTTSISLVGTGKVSIPMFANDDNLAGAWVGEAGVIPVLQGTFIAATLEPTKLAGITTCTRELLTATNEQVEQILQSGMRRTTGKMLDRTLLDDLAKVAGVRPAGLLFGAPVNASGGPNSVTGDLLTAISSIEAAGGGDDIVLIMNTAQRTGLQLSKNLLGQAEFPEVQQGNLVGYPILSSPNVPAGTVIVMDAAFYVDAAGVPEFEASEHATLTMANADGTAPTQAITAAGAIGTPGQVLPDGGIHVAGGAAGAGTAGFVAMSMFQQYSVALRLILPVSWVMRRAGMVSVITNVAWGTEPEVTP